MRRLLYLAAVAVVALAVTTTALAKLPKGAVRGTFDKTTALGDDNLVRLLTTSSVFCVWSKGHVLVHVSFRNRAVEHVTLHVIPRYTIRNGGTHGDGITNIKSVGINARAFRAVYIDAGAPDGVPKNSPIGKCRPYLWDEKSG
jgi:hypothetical protein